MSPFVRHDMMSTDPERTTRFYAELFGWDAEVLEVPRVGAIATLRADGRLVGAVMPEAEGDGSGSGWIPSIAAPSREAVDALSKRASAVGGALVAPPTDAASIGRVARLVDPAGAPFLLVAPERSIASARFAWDELHVASDATLDLTLGFYLDLFGWRAERHPYEEDAYTTLHRERARDPFAGVVAGESALDGPSRWLPYVGVASIDETTERALQLGAEVVLPPDEIAEVGRYAILRDPTEGMFALLARSR